MKEQSKCRCTWLFVGHLCMALAFVAGIAALVMLLWNCLIPSIIGWNIVTYWQALGLIVLANLIFFPHCGGKCHPHHGHHGKHPHCGCEEQTPAEEA